MIVLVKINHPRYTYHPPQGLLYIANALKDAGFAVKIFHIRPEEVSEYAQKIVDLQPLFVGFSVFTGEAMRSYAWLCRKIKSLSSTTIVWGNAHPTLIPEQCLNEDYIDIVVMGEGEITVVELASSFKTGTPELKAIKGIGFKDANKDVVINPERPFIENLDEYKPEWGLLDVGRYLTVFAGAKRALAISTSRGCPFDCGFCYNRKFNRQRWRAHSVEYVTSLAGELKEKYSIDGIIITDDNFFVDKERAFKIARKIGLPYYCETRSSYFNEDFGRALDETKCRAVLLGMESGSNRVLNFINKRTTVKENLDAVRVVSKYSSITVSGSFIVAFPGETEEECKETMALIVQLLEMKKEMNFTLGYYLPYPGSRLYELAREKGFIPPARTEDWQDLDRWASETRINWVDWMTSEKAVALRTSVWLLRDCYRSSSTSVLSLIKNFVKKQVMSLKVESFRMKLLLGIYEIFFLREKKRGYYRLITFLLRIYFLPPISRLKNWLIKTLFGRISKVVRKRTEA